MSARRAGIRAVDGEGLKGQLRGEKGMEKAAVWDGMICGRGSARVAAGAGEVTAGGAGTKARKNSAEWEQSEWAGGWGNGWPGAGRKS